MTHDYKKKKVKGNGYNHIWTEEKLEALGDELIEFCNKPDTIHFIEFTRKKKHATGWLYRLAEEHPIFKEKFNIAREVMSGKIVKACWVDREKNATFGEKYLPIYDKDYKELLQWKEEIKKRELSEKEANLIVNAVKFTQKAGEDDSKDD